MPPKVLVLGGTGEARALAAALALRTDLRVTSSLAGRVRDTHLPDGEVRVGGFGGVDGLTEFLRAEGIAAVVDATHPFAEGITANAVAACTKAQVPMLVLHRPGWAEEPGDAWRRVASLDGAATLLPELGERVFLTTGRLGLSRFAHLDLWFLVRSVDPPAPPLPPRTTTLLARGPFSVEDERALLREHRIDVLVTKDSGGTMTAAKLRAAREVGLPVVVVQRPPSPDVPSASTVDDALRWLDSVAQQ